MQCNCDHLYYHRQSIQDFFVLCFGPTVVQESKKVENLSVFRTGFSILIFVSYEENSIIGSSKSEIFRIGNATSNSAPSPL